MVANRYQGPVPNWLAPLADRGPMWLPSSRSGAKPIGSVPDAGIEMLNDPKRIRDRVDQLSDSARRSICALQPGTGGSPGRPRRVATRLIVEGGAAGEYDNLTVRCSPDPLPYRMVIIDEAIAVAAGQGSASRGAAMVVEEPVLVQGLLCLFEAAWADCGRARPDNPTLDERNLLERMATGSTDEAIARLLGISDRQVRRRTACLLQRLGVSSRFAAGAEAVRRGWL